jgi:hypothetical protein
MAANPFTEEEIEEEIRKYMETLDIMKQTPEIVFSQSDIGLRDTYRFAQYVYDNRVLITVAGELHNVSFRCLSRDMSLSEYCYNLCVKNPNARIVMEYNKYHPHPEQIGSKFIRETYTKFKKEGMLNQIIPIDVRTDYLQRHGQNAVYGQFPDISPNDIQKYFINPFVNNEKRGFFRPDKKKFLPEVYRFLNGILQGINRGFKELNNALFMGQPIPIPTIQESLKALWGAVMDYFVLCKVLQNPMVSGIDEYVVVVGVAHAKHLEYQLKQICAELNLQESSLDSCVRLFNTVKRDNIVMDVIMDSDELQAVKYNMNLD